MFLLAILQAQAPVQPPPTVEPPRLEATAVIDGRLDEAAWGQALRLDGFRQYRPVDGRPAEEQTAVLVWYAPDAIHFGIIALDSRPGTVRATNADRDNLGDDDRIRLYLDTFLDRRRAFFFGVNPLGVQEDGVWSEGTGGAGSLFGGTEDNSPDYLWQSKGALTDSGYTVEIRIPFKSLRIPGSEPQTWGFNIERLTQRTGYLDTWTDTRRASASFLAQSGALTGLHGMQRGIVVEAQPFMTATSAGLRDVASGDFDRDDPDFEAGVNFRVGFPAISLDGTINPDFSTVESDVGQVTVNERFALFFPEKRPFFLEGIELFSTPNQLVYTRQIVNPIAGAKVSGKVGGLGIAYLAALDEVPVGDDALFNVLRLRNDVGAGSTIGVTYTDRVAGDDYNRVLAADARYLFGRLYFIEAQLGSSWTRDILGARSDPIWKAEFDRTGRGWGFNYQLNGIGDDFETRSGFVNRTGVVTGRAFNRFSFYGAPGASLENFTVFAGLNRLWDYDRFDFGDALEGSEEANATIDWKGGWETGASIERSYYRFDAADFLGYTVDTPGGTEPFLPADEVSNLWTAQLSAETPTFQRWSAGASLDFGAVPLFEEATEGHGFGLDGSVEFRPVASVRIGLGAVYQRLFREDDSEFGRSIIQRTRLEIQPNRAFFFRIIAEYAAERRAALQDHATGDPILILGVPAAAEETNGMRYDILFSYEPVPGTAAFLGYGAALQDTEAFGFDDLERRNDGFFAKLSYQFRW